MAIWGKKAARGQAGAAGGSDLDGVQWRRKDGGLVGDLAGDGARSVRERRLRLAVAVAVAVALAAAVAVVFAVTGEGEEGVTPDAVARLVRDEGVDARTREGAARLALLGAKLTPAQAGAHREHLAQDPGDLATRTVLVAFENLRVSKDPDAADRLADHVLWLAQNAPETAILATPYAQLSPGHAARPKVRKELLKAVVRRTDLRVLWDAALWLAPSDPVAADGLLGRGQALVPSDAAWAQERGTIELGVRAGGVEARAVAGPPRDADLAAAFAALDARLGGRGGKEPFVTLGDKAMAAFRAKRPRLAYRLASEGVERAAAHRDDWAYGEVVHVSNIVLGHLALQSGDVTWAVRYLRRAGRASGSPRLRTRGPDTTLAAALLKVGKRDAVLRYLADCGKFWKVGRERGLLAKWRGEIRDGKTPDFRADAD